MSAPDFDKATLTWVDRDGFDEGLNRRRRDGRVNERDADLLRDWNRDGFAFFPGAAKEAEIDALLADCRLLRQEQPLRQEPPPFLELADLHDHSEAARQLILLPRVVSFLRHVFDEPPVAMQSLFLEHAGEQAPRQDFALVETPILSRLVGAFVALEEVNADNGPLFYYPGSHRLAKYDWGGGQLASGGGDAAQVEDFGRHLERACEAAGLERKILIARKGDVFLWHAALVHGVLPPAWPGSSRLSLVSHFSSVSAYPRDRRFAEVDPLHYERGGGLIYRQPVPPLMAKLKRRVQALLGRP